MVLKIETNHSVEPKPDYKLVYRTDQSQDNTTIVNHQLRVNTLFLVS